MRMNWYYRTILSYAPILFVIISSMIFVIFLALNNASERKYLETNKAILDRIVFNADANLMLIERNVVSKVLMDGEIQDYFANASQDALGDFLLQKKLIDLSLTLPFANTIYIYNEAERRIISDLGSYSLRAFGDADFLTANYGRKESAGWFNPRSFAYSPQGEEAQQVVSLVKFVYTGDDMRGALVVNVYQRSFMEYLNSFDESDYNHVRLIDAAAASESPDKAPTMNPIQVQSDYTGWTYVSEGVHDQGYNWLALFSNAWMVIWVTLILLALIGFTIITHIHYKPIQSIMEKVSQFSNRKSEELGIKGANNEFTFIEIALDHLLKRSLDYENLHKEDSLLRQQRLFHDLLAGHLVLTDEEFQQRLAEFNLSAPYDRLGVMVAELDRYAEFTDKYKVKDQHLLKFIIESAFRDLGQSHHAFVWHAWMEPHRIAFVVHHTADPHNTQATTTYAEEFKKWIHQHLELTLTIGIGADSTSIDTLADSYRNAVENVELKTVLGIHSIIDNRKSAGIMNLDRYAYLQALDYAAQSFRMNESEWREKLTQVFGELSKMRFRKRDMAEFAQAFLKRMEQAVLAMSSPIQTRWKSDYQDRFASLTETAETLAEFQEQFMSLMNQFEACVEEDRQARRHHSLAMQAKHYIDAHFTDPGLSLVQVSDYLNLQPSALSVIFKEEIGEKFVDYVLKVRMQQAKQLLLETEDSIQSVAINSGYQNVNSFYRAFKKFQDIPPGEYRNMYRAT
ncbi:transcriptional regulator, AraC family [Paenibacillus sp. oral taxon 786 str. D14]|uniref:helix-turn-helix domain-containing protein n=1 Tax=Paenibacillus sp. oral taxon 786 TaxID=652715 RepID=UPI0001AFD12E|nr:helix-turn-helix domain-containing protein [Paenibacillus sp. oral taxon 786]EES74068.1 transcriptional regulator, AraC family [Paenibacillus sp. oral taxon 786 str. D14]